MKATNISGFCIMEKPPGYNPTPQISHTIEPVDKLSFDLWQETIRASIDGLKTPDATLVKKFYLNA